MTRWYCYLCFFFFSFHFVVNLGHVVNYFLALYLGLLHFKQTFITGDFRPPNIGGCKHDNGYVTLNCIDLFD